MFTATVEDARGVDLDRGAVAIALMTKGLLLAFGVLAYQTLAEERPPDLLAIWNRWDTPHYLDLARYGYQPSGEIGLFIVFYPLYPGLIALATLVVRDVLPAALLVSTVASVAAAVLLARLVRLDFPGATALATVWFLFVFPTSYFLHIGYTESLFLALVLGSFLAARRDRWLVAGALGGLAALTRINGLLLLPALAVEALGNLRAEGRWRRGWLWLVLIPGGFALYLALNLVVTGDPLRFVTVLREHWYKTPQWPWVGVGDAARSIFWRDPADAQMLGIQELLFTGIGAAATLASWFYLRGSYAVWMTLNLLLFASTSFVLSTPRYVLVLFPAFTLFALLGRDRYWYAVLTAWSLLFLGLFAGQFVQGRWGF